MVWGTDVMFLGAMQSLKMKKERKKKDVKPPQTSQFDEFWDILWYHSKSSQAVLIFLPLFK